MVDLCGDGQTTCPKPANLPVGRSQGSALRTAAGNPLLCGGDYEDSTCLEYIPETDSWANGPVMTGSRVDTTSVEFPNGTFWIMGSYRGPDVYTTELLDGDIFVDGPSLPLLGNVGFPCSTQVSNDITFYGNNFGYLYEDGIGDFERTEDMLYTAYGASCGAATLQNGTKIVVVAGGITSSTAQSRVQIFDLETRQWSEGPPLPSPLKYGLSVPYGNSFLVVGGRNEQNTDVGTVYQFDPINLSWIIRPEALALPRSYFFMTSVDKERFC